MYPVLLSVLKFPHTQYLQFLTITMSLYYYMPLNSRTHILPFYCNNYHVLPIITLYYYVPLNRCTPVNYPFNIITMWILLHDFLGINIDMFIFMLHHIYLGI